MDAKNNKIIPIEFNAIEQASYHSWRALEQIERDGWIWRFANGYTKRANSVNVLSVTGDHITQNIIKSEEAYNARGLPCIFRLLSYIDNSYIEAILDQRGYCFGEHSLVLIQDLHDMTVASNPLCVLKCNEWLPIYYRLNQKELPNQITHLEMLNKISHPALFAVLQKDHIDLSCALGVIANGYFGLFDMVTHPDYRNQGHGAELITGMLSWAKQQGAATAYVQVVSENLPAVRLYKKLGYEPGYEYHYRIQNIK